MFGIGNLPTGDKDPFALRRHALGVVRMLIDRNLQLQIFPLLNTAIEAFPSGALSETREKIRDEVGGFFIERIKVYFRDLGYSTLEVDAALYAGDFGVWADIPKRLSAVRAFAALPEAPALAAANKRVGNILKKAEGTVEPRINEALLVEPAEKALADALKLIAPKADAAWAAGQYAENLQALAALKGPVDDFFDKVMVNAEDPALKANRLGLLATLHAAMNRVADLSRLAA
jgi:glycyl-tRNA synthetase beta chain